LLAVLYNANRKPGGRPFTAADFNPHAAGRARRRQPDIENVKITDLKGLLLKAGIREAPCERR